MTFNFWYHSDNWPKTVHAITLCTWQRHPRSLGRWRVIVNDNCIKWRLSLNTPEGRWSLKANQSINSSINQKCIFAEFQQNASSWSGLQLGRRCTSHCCVGTFLSWVLLLRAITEELWLMTADCSRLERQKYAHSCRQLINANGKWVSCPAVCDAYI